MGQAHVSDAVSALQKLLTACKKKRTLNKRETIIPYLESPRCLYLVTKGSLRIFLSNTDSDGVVCIGHLIPGDIFAEQGLFGTAPMPLSTATFQARTDVQLLCVTHVEIQRAALGAPSIYADLSALINQRLGDTTEKLLQLVFEDLEQRCYASLVELTRLPDALTHPLGMQITVTRIELAQMTGCNRESAGRVLRVLHDKGLIEANGNGSQIVVLGVRHGLPALLREGVAECI
ncbi:MULTISPECIES: cyclic nucleotide-binding domain-containing protein [Pseudomonas]|uniref:cyclic nucleotide-binding domain-containing protein n=1 Tax=Pseudomonas TaxID=286 RepID=UPI00070CF0F7|nr:MULTISPECIES: cyclic nucleotide-binding domain-containing protein [Pseudomonas]KQW19912.1 hypothetical protein ASC85_08680 [Pseudomonas sp. Root401]WHS57498.1 cyclic nucleotide-binding domain-containing protein [Pseudomonas brassicacearum]WNZ87421.1 cyclic nucleotide-binding domain-containing protein [Pseudomonas sp. P108]